MWIGNTPPINIINNNVLLNNTTPNTHNTPYNTPNNTPYNTPYNTPNNTPNTPYNTPYNTPDNTTPNLSPNLNKIKISPITNLYLKTLISKTPPTSIFEIKRKNSFNDFKL